MIYASILQKEQRQLISIYEVFFCQIPWLIHF